MKTVIQKILASLAKQILKKYNPRVIGITGSVGKTSTKEAVFFVVSQKYRAYRPLRNFNNEVGLPLAIIGVDSPGRSLLGWLGVIIRALGLIIIKQKYPEVLVLEYGVDRPGDMDYLLSIAHPNISIITNIGISHYEFFKDVETIENEKGKLAVAVPQDGYLIVNADNEKAFSQKRKTTSPVVSYSVGGNADVIISPESEHVDGVVQSTIAIKTVGREFEAMVQAIGTTHVSALAAGVAVAEILKIETDLLIKGLQEYRPVPGRLNIISGIKHAVIIDDTYNAAPDSMREALQVLSRLPGNYKIAVLGDMLELGAKSDAEHEAIGKLVAGLGVHRLVTVGPSGKIISDAAIAAGFPDSKVSVWDNAEAAKIFVQNLLEPNSLILIKGSAGMRMEKITKEIMAEPMRASELLVRQYGKWLNS